MRGVLPWRKTDFFHPYDTIFESFYTFGFFAKVFGYGTTFDQENVKRFWRSGRNMRRG